jgi:hypothetical protein
VRCSPPPAGLPSGRASETAASAGCRPCRVLPCNHRRSIDQARRSRCHPSISVACLSDRRQAVGARNRPGPHLVFESTGLDGGFVPEAPRWPPACPRPSGQASSGRRKRANLRRGRASRLRPCTFICLHRARDGQGQAKPCRVALRAILDRRCARRTVRCLPSNGAEWFQPITGFADPGSRLRLMS